MKPYLYISMRLLGIVLKTLNMGRAPRGNVMALSYKTKVAGSIPDWITGFFN
jgi:hypothetical protein